MQHEDAQKKHNALINTTNPHMQASSCCEEIVIIT